MDDFPNFNEFLLGTNKFQLKTFDVGQGNCLMLKAPNDVFTLIDAGTTSSIPGKAAIIKAVASAMGSNTFDNVVITHPDADHCNLIPKLPSASSPSNVHIAMSSTDYSSDIQTWLKGKNIHTYAANYHSATPNPNFGVTPKNFNIYILSANRSGDANTHSMVLSIDCGTQVLVLTGDATSTTERTILSNWDEASLKATLLCFGHHGSNHSSSSAFIKATAPEVGVFSASARHMGYGHPRCSVYEQALKYIVDLNTTSTHNITCFENWAYSTKKTKKAIFSTADSGLIEFDSDGKDWTMTWGG